MKLELGLDLGLELELELEVELELVQLLDLELVHFTAFSLYGWVDTSESHSMTDSVDPCDELNLLR